MVGTLDCDIRPPRSETSVHSTAQDCPEEAALEGVVDQRPAPSSQNSSADDATSVGSRSRSGHWWYCRGSRPAQIASTWAWLPFAASCSFPSLPLKPQQGRRSSETELRGGIEATPRHRVHATKPPAAMRQCPHCGRIADAQDGTGVGARGSAGRGPRGIAAAALRSPPRTARATEARAAVRSRAACAMIRARRSRVMSSGPAADEAGSGGASASSGSAGAWQIPPLSHVFFFSWLARPH